ncbi:MAG: glycosyltransferase family 4 protein [Candidatus Kerfeldbacteria bacterium]
MIIGIDASRANKENKTGTEWYAYNVLEEFKKIIPKEDQVILYSKDKLRGDLSKLPNNFSNKILRWPPGFLWTQLRLSWEVFFHKPDVLFIPAHTIPLLSPKKTVTTLHDVGFEEFHELYSKKTIGPENFIINFIFGIAFRILTLGKYKNNELEYHRWSARLALEKAKKVITISDFSINEIKKHFNISGDKLVNVYNSYNPIFRKISDESEINKILQKYNIKDNFFLYIGRLEEKKNIPRLIEAFSIFKKENFCDTKLVLVGAQGFGYDRVKSNIIKYNLESEVIELGWIDNIDLPYLVNAAKIFCFPSLYEGFGMPIIEAMVCGTPVITSDFGAMKEVAKDAALLVDSYNIKNIADGMSIIYNDNELSEKLVQKGFERVKSFSWEKTASMIKEVIYNVAK